MSLRPIHADLRVSLGAIALIVIGLTGCASGPGFPTVEAPPKTENPAETYLLEAGNRIRVTVFNEGNLSGDFTVDPAGNIALPLVGNVPASGITAKALAKRIEAVLKKDAYLNEPRVAVEVQTFRPFYVLGEVRQPGEFAYMTGMTVLSAIAKAGGYDYRAREGEVILVRQEHEEQREYHAVERTPILPGDIIRVLQRRF
jgi:polysaccharide export outer membrane protein